MLFSGARGAAGAVSPKSKIAVCRTMGLSVVDGAMGAFGEMGANGAVDANCSYRTGGTMIPTV